MDSNFDCIVIYYFPNLFSIPGGRDYLLKDIDGAVWLAAKVQFSAMSVIYITTWLLILFLKL